MTVSEKLAQLKLFLGISGTDEDSLLTAYLSLAKDEIIAWLWGSRVPENATDVPKRYEPVQIQAVVAGYSQRGAEAQSHHHEGDIVRVWKHEDMIAYIRSHVVPFAGVW